MKRIIIVFWMFIFFSFLYLPKTSFMKEKGKVLRIFTWPDFFDNAKIEEFEQETGIKVKLSYFTSNEELLIKLKTNHGKDYDLITPSDYAVKMLIDQGSLAPIEHEKINVIHHLYPFVVNQSFDPQNKYSIPFVWEAYGLGYYKSLFPDSNFTDFSPIFENPGKNYKITMIPDPFEAIFLASLYLYGPIDSLSTDQIKEVKDLLKAQKEWVEAYVDDRSKYLISTNNCQMALFKSNYFVQIAKNNPGLTFVVPEKNTFITIESFSIPKHSPNKDLVYSFLNYFYNPENSAPHIHRTPLFPADPRMLPYLNEPPLYFEILNDLKKRKDLHYFKYLLPEQEIRNAWVEVKAN